MGKMKEKAIDIANSKPRKILVCPETVCWLTQQPRKKGQCQWAIVRDGKKDCGYG